MQTTSLDYKEGIFLRELKNRFLCEVRIDGEDTVCYVPSSCHLSNFMELEGKRVLLFPNVTKGTRTNYAVFAIPFKRSYIILNSSLANRAVEASIHSRRFSFLGRRDLCIKEHSINGYKTDLYLPETKTIVEIKSLITPSSSALFPTVYSERALEQLQQLKRFCAEGYRICYLIVSLNPYVKTINLDTATEFFSLLEDCTRNGMILKGFSSRFKDRTITLEKEIKLLCTPQR